LSGIRWTTGIGIAVGGVGGAIAALLGAPKAPAPLAPVAPQAAVASAASSAATAEPSSPAREQSPVPSSSEAPPGAQPSAAAVEPAPVASAASAQALTPPATREALHKAMLFCDQKKDFDECGRAAEALEKGTTAAPDPEQAKRFRRIALTHLVAQCEAGAPHACFVLAAKYRAGSELAANPATAQALEKRGVDLCRLRDAPECPDRVRHRGDTGQPSP
jgi:hypothetical protein